MRYLILSLLLASGLTASAQVPDYVPTDGLSAWYDFNANLIDGSGNSNDAQNHGATFGPDRWGNELFAVDFTGPAQWVETSPWLTGIQNNFTLSIWFNLRSFEAQDGPSANIFHHRAHWKDKRLTTGVHQSTGQSLGESIGYGDRQFSGTNYLDLYSQSIELNVWNHVVVSGDNSNFFLFVNGELIDQAPRTFDSDWSGLFYGAYLGANGYQSESTMNGMVDEFGAWSRTLSILEIQGLFAAGELVFGCIDEQACNFNLEANVGDDSCIPSGCIDSQACNFNPEAECEGEVCDYTCCPGPGCCSIGHYWDWDLEKCFDIAPSDTDFDGCVSMTDLLDLLSVFGTCNEIPWSCGDPLEYQGYDYETVQVGEQCWFAENLKTEYYRTGDIIPGSAPDSALWTSQGAQTVLYFDSSYIADRGRLYNALAVTDNRGLCPQGWHVPTDDDFLSLESFIGMPEDQLILVESSDGRGLNGGFAEALKSQTGWYGAGAGSDDYGLSLTQTGYQFYADGQDGFGNQDQGAYWTSSQVEGDDRFFYRGFSSDNNGILRWHDDPAVGFGVRCIKDPE